MLRSPRLKIQRMREAWTNPSNTGIFTQLQSLDVPWSDLGIATELNLNYHLNRSGKKIISPLIESYTDNEGILTAPQKAEIADAIFAIYNDKWTKLYSLLSLEYNPISNYDMTETEEIEGATETELHRTGTETNHGTGTDAHAYTGTQTNADTGTETTTHTGTKGVVTNETSTGSSEGATDNTVYGFNSTTAVNDSGSENTTTAESERDETSTTTDNLTDTRTDALSHLRTDNLTDTETRNISDQLTRNTTDAETGSNTVSRTLTRSGNIGVTTSQQMIQASIELWRWNFFTQVFEDIDTILTISTY